MTTIYTHNGIFGAESFGTYDWFRDTLAPCWADWHRDADTDMSLDEYIDDRLYHGLIELSPAEAARMHITETGEAVRIASDVTYNGREIDLRLARELMDDELCEEIHGTVESAQEFMDAYASAHLGKYGTEFVFA